MHECVKYNIAFRDLSFFISLISAPQQDVMEKSTDKIVMLSIHSNRYSHMLLKTDSWHCVKSFKWQLMYFYWTFTTLSKQV